MKIKDILATIIGFVGSATIFLYGGIDLHIQTLFYAMIFDYFLGVIAAAFFHRSNKTNTGRLSSDAMIKGLIKKCMVLFAVALCYRIDLLINVSICRNGAIIGFVASEAISIIENLGLIGVPIPSQIKDIIEILNEKKVKQ